MKNFFFFFSALRRLTTFLVIAGQFLFLGKKVPSRELQSVILMVLGKFLEI